MAERIPWGRVIAEALVIVASILLALGVEAWWGFRQDRVEERTRLDAVASELREARLGFETHLRQLAAEDSLVAEILSEVQAYSGNARLLDSLLFALGPFNEYAPPLSAYEDATATGGLSLIRSDSIRRTLGEYRRVVSDDLTEQRIARDHFQTQIAPLWIQYVNVRDHVAAGAAAFPGLLPEHLPDIPFASRYSELLADRRFANQLVERSIFVFRVRDAHQRVIGTIDELLNLLE